eukprot:Blabericola_migrator_1__7787@NODE_3987_length_1396_cov_50_465764_g2457_i0_p2_GENE_NODE_3987_length_1396_cov_50_465764_g2457_i0NODE_3987_length_1396_cov_50_465764_g2457_i0_p2_ORF_typecomplete_len160_score26_93SET/PF00856_28/3_7e07SET/PF00856_28/4_7e02_NODE_3987_length_1396_cov_50_465764_g2457_i08981377
MYEIDGIKEPQDGVGAATFINHATRPHSNVRWARFEDKRSCFRRMFAQALRPIAAGEEIFLDYGKTYWENHRKWKTALEQRRDLLCDETESETESTTAIRSSNEPSHESRESGEAILLITTSEDDNFDCSDDESKHLQELSEHFHMKPNLPPACKPSQT